MKIYAFARYLAFSFSIVISASAYSDSGDQAVVTDQLENNLEVKLDFSQRNKICDGMLSGFGTVKLRVERETGKPFVEGYKLIHCPISRPLEKQIGWDLIGKAFQGPPSKRPIRVTMDLFEYLEQTDPALLQYIFTHKDYRGRGIYDYLRLAEERFSKPNNKYRKYYAVFTKRIARFDPNKQP